MLHNTPAKRYARYLLAAPLYQLFAWRCATCVCIKQGLHPFRASDATKTQVARSLIWNVYHHTVRQASVWSCQTALVALGYLPVM